MAEPLLLQVLEPGMLTTVQDLGRPGLARFGVPPGGALDRGALILGNRLLGNDPGAAGLEITLLGPRIRFSAAGAIAITGGDLGAKLNGMPVPRWAPVAVEAGDELAFNPASAGTGARAYLLVAGGLALPVVMGSRSTELIGAFGGLDGRALRAGDTLPTGEVTLNLSRVLRRRLVQPPPVADARLHVRVVLGPQLDRFSVPGIEAFLGPHYTVSAKSNRQGMRLVGSPIEHSNGADIISEGIAHGAVQVPGDGQPIVLLGGRQTVGGYVKIATVIGADLDGLGQLRPGDELRFRMQAVEEAREATLAYRALLGPDAVTESPRAVAGARFASPTEEEFVTVAGNWDPDGVIRVIEALERTGSTEFWLETADLTLKLNRGVVTSSISTPPPQRVSDETPVTAPVLGVLYRRAAPDAPLLVEVGEEVVVGQVICVLEVMKTYHEVTAPCGGVLTAFLVEDGQFVEFGQLIARIAIGKVET